MKVSTRDEGYFDNSAAKSCLISGVENDMPCGKVTAMWGDGAEYIYVVVRSAGIMTWSQDYAVRVPGETQVDDGG